MPSRLDRLAASVPFLGEYYLNNYARIRYNIFRMSRLIPLIRYPRYVHLLVTFDCNFTCKQCQVDANNREANILSLQEITRVIKDIRNAGVNHLLITGGEPLVRKDIFDILDFAGKSGIPRITLATNGYLVENYRKELSRLRIDNVVISIDDVGERNDAIRGRKGAFEKALKALEIFREIGVRTREINTTVFPDTISHMEDLAKAVRSSCATRWVMGLLIPTGRARSIDDKSFGDEEYRRVFGIIRKLRRYVPVELLSHTGYLKNFCGDVTSEPFFCRAGIETCAINPDGEVMPCNIVSDSAFSQGNVREKPFGEIWKDGFREIRNPELPDRCSRCEFLPACRGGCWSYRVLKDRYCFKSFCT